MQSQRMNPGTAAQRWSAIGLIALGIASLVFYRIGIRANGAKDIAWFLELVGCQATLYAFASWLILRMQTRGFLFLIAVSFAALFRLSILFSPPFLSDDIYRYVWDGRVQAAGINPYRYIPADQALAQLRDESIYPKINRRDYAHTMYPPIAEATYFLATRVSESVTWMKASMLGFEAIGIWAIAQLLTSFGLSRQRILIYAWHPLVVWEFAGSGHLDAMVIAFISLALLARRRNAEVATGIALASATLVKLFPIVLLPALYKRWNWKMPLAFAMTVVAAYLPYLRVGPLGVFGFLPGYASERGIVSGAQFFLLSAAHQALPGAYLPTVIYLFFAAVVLLALAYWSIRTEDNRNGDFAKKALILSTAFTVLLSPHFSWYFAWLVPFLCFVPALAIFYVTLASFLLYLTWLGDAPDQVFKLNALIYLPCLILAAIEIWRHRGKYLKI